MLGGVPGEVVFHFDGRRHAVPVDDAEGLLAYVVEPNLVSQRLHSKIKAAVGAGVGDITLGQETRAELSLVLDVIEKPTAAESGLRSALRG
jgi:hypothetical protein